MAVRDPGVTRNPLDGIKILVEFEELPEEIVTEFPIRDQVTIELPPDDRVSAEFSGNTILAEIFEGYIIQTDSDPVPREFIYTQEKPSNLWTINHPLQRQPYVAIYDSEGDQCFCDIEYLNDSTILLRFSEEVSGVAHLT